ncbi:hypothetical protein D3C78_562260 [compost metagenome]
MLRSADLLAVSDCTSHPRRGGRESAALSPGCSDLVAQDELPVAQIAPPAAQPAAGGPAVPVEQGAAVAGGDQQRSLAGRPVAGQRSFL